MIEPSGDYDFSFNPVVNHVPADGEPIHYLVDRQFNRPLKYWAHYAVFISDPFDHGYGKIFI